MAFDCSPPAFYLRLNAIINPTDVESFQKLLQRMKKRALAIILPGVSYQEALCQSGLAPLKARRAESCVNFMKKVKSGNPLLPICEGLLVIIMNQNTI